MANTPTVNSTATPNYSIDQILQATQPAKQPGGFRKVLGAVVGGVGNMFAPGIGSLIGGTISGGGALGGISVGVGAGGLGGVGGLGSDTMQYLQMQRELEQQSEAFQAASMVLKSRHDASMAAIHNIS
jgi:hypothetical protein